MIVLSLGFVRRVKGGLPGLFRTKAFLCLYVWHHVCQGESGSCCLSVPVNRSEWHLLDGSYCFCLTSHCTPSPGQSIVFFPEHLSDSSVGIR